MATFDDLGINVFGRTSGAIYTVCPQCSRDRKKKRAKCLSVNITEGLYNCHHCMWSGKVGGRGNDGRSDFYQPRQKPQTYKKPSFKPSGEEMPAKTLDWFAHRGIPADVLMRNRVERRTVFMPQTGKEEPVVTFNYYQRGEHVNGKHRTADKQFRMETGAELTLYKIDDVRPGGRMIWTEGEIDALSLEVAGYPYAVSVPNGAPPVGSNQLREMPFLESAQEVIDAAAYHIIATDDDPPGRALADELIRRLGPERCWRVVYPEGCKDANDVLVKYGVPAVAELVENAQPVPIDGLFTVGDLEQRVMDLWERGLPSGPAISHPEIGKTYRPRTKEWSVVTGIPGHGKSSWLDWLLIRLAFEFGWRFCICSPENLPIERHIASLAQIYMNIPFGDGPTPRMDLADVGMATSWLHQHFHFAMPPEDLSLDSILELASAAVFRFGVNGLVIDPWNELDHTPKNGETETQYISRAITKIRRWARTHDCHVWVVAHPKMQHKNQTTGKFDPPTLYDISGSAHWYNKADMGVCVFRDDELCETQVHVQKVRFRENGEKAMIQMHYDVVTGNFR